MIPVEIESDGDGFDCAKKGFVIKAVENVITITAEGGEMLFQALSKVIYFINSDESFEPSDVDEIFIFPKREEYIKNPDLFTPVWAYVWAPPAWLINYEEKKDSFPKHNRPFCWAHRGGGTYYPENSAEAVISSIYMGADVMELDFRYTLDKKVVLMHWETLHQSTDWDVKHGKNGLPESDKLEDWTLAQLRELRLKPGRYFTSDEGTEYLIPTLEDILRACEGRSFFIMDKMNPDKEWDTVYRAICETKCYEAFAFAYGMPEETVMKYRQEMLDKFGKTGPYFYWRKHAGSLERECLSDADRLAVFDQFSAGCDTNIMTNYVRELIEYIDEHYSPSEQ